MTFEVRGNGVHSLRWAFQRDNEGEGGSNRAWLADVDITRILSVDFADGGAVVGTVPDACEYYEGESVVVPDCGSLSYPKHTFAGWSDGAATFMPGDIYSSESDALLTAVWKRNELESPVISGPEMFEADTCVIEISSANGLAIRYTLDGSDPTEESPLYSTPITITQTTTIKAIVVKENHFDSPVAEFTVVRGVWTFGEYLNCPDMQFVTAGDAEWMRAKNVSDDGYAMRSGDITHSQTSRLEVVVNGSGMIAFKCKVEGEIAKNIIWDGLAFSIDGVRQGGLMGNEAWMQKTYFVEGKGAHTLCWSYVKDESGEGNGEDCAWLDEIVWIPGHIPELPNTVTAEEIAIVLGGSADEKLAANITSAADYAAFRAWALEVKGADGALAGGEAVKKSPNAWLSYALDTAGLIIAEPKEGDVAIEAFESAVSDGAFDISVKVAGVDVGEGAKEANLKKVFAVEGVSDLGSGTFTSESLEVDAAQSANGKVKFTVSPKGDKPAQFFFKVKMK